MHGDNGVLVDVLVVSRVISGADVFILVFPHLQESLLVDGRSNEKESLLIQVVDPLGSGAERVDWLYRRRPSLGTPRSVQFVAWPHSVGFLIESGIWDRIRMRVEADVQEEAGLACDTALRLMQNLEASAMQSYLKGNDCRDLWPRPEVPEGSV